MSLLEILLVLGGICLGAFAGTYGVARSAGLSAELGRTILLLAPLLLLANRLFRGHSWQDLLGLAAILISAAGGALVAGRTRRIGDGRQGTSDVGRDAAGSDRDCS